MTVYGFDGRVVHHRDCTYCAFRQQLDVSRGRRKKEVENCAMHNRMIPDPQSGQIRLCDDYLQLECECEQCQRVRQSLQTEASIDKKVTTW